MVLGRHYFFFWEKVLLVSRSRIPYRHICAWGTVITMLNCIWRSPVFKQTYAFVSSRLCSCFHGEVESCSFSIAHQSSSSQGQCDVRIWYQDTQAKLLSSWWYCQRLLLLSLVILQPPRTIILTCLEHESTALLPLYLYHTSLCHSNQSVSRI